MIGSLGWQELLIILVILALLFGASRVAGLGGALGRGIREFRTEARGSEDEKKDDAPPPPSTTSNTSNSSVAGGTPPPPAPPPSTPDDTPRT